VLAWELVSLVQVRLGEGFVCLDILDDTHREIFGIYAVERILAALTLAIISASLTAFQTRAAPVGTTGFTITHVPSPVSSCHDAYFLRL
jgi:hypothetical protein